jgi:hypothetical protein
MKEKKILRLEEEVRFDELSSIVKEQLLISDEFIPLNQEQANWRVVIYRDEILELDEYKNWLIEKAAEAQ